MMDRKYKFQGFGAGPTTPRMRAEIAVIVFIVTALYVGVSWFLLAWW